MTRRATDDRRASYRKRLLAAACGSLLLHLLFTRGLAVTTLRLDADRVADADKVRERKERKRADFPLQVAKTSPPPAHERPLDPPLPVPTPEPRRRPETPDRVREVAERRPEETATPPAPTPVDPGRPAPRRQADARLTPAAVPAPSRDREAPAPALPSQVVVAPVAPAEPVATANAPAAAPAQAAPRAAEPAPSIASRWRPREVALLERLTAPAATAVTSARPADAADLAPGAAAAGPSRQAVAAADAAAQASAGSNAGADAIAAPVAATAGQPAAVRPRQVDARAATGAATATPRGMSDNEAPRLVAIPRADAALVASTGGAVRASQAEGAAIPAGQPAAVSRRSAADPAAGGTVDGTVATVAAPKVVGAGREPGPAPGPQAGSRPQSSASAAVGNGVAAVAGMTEDTSIPLPGGPRAGGPSLGTAGVVARSDVDGEAGTGPRAISRSTAVPTAPEGSNQAEAIAAPRTVSSSEQPLVATAPQLPRAGDRPVSGAAVTQGSGPPPIDADEEELSVPGPQVSAIVSAGSGQRDIIDPGTASGSGPLERVAAATVLPTDGRVRDVAEAFARRAKARPKAAPGSAAETADRLVDRGLEFLARSQQADGRWSLGRFAGAGADDVPRLQSDTAATGLALLSFLGAGHDHYGGPYRDTVRRGLEYLLAVQKADGDLYVPADKLSNSCAWLYSHGIAAIAVCEAVGMTGDPRIRPAAEKACGFIAASQHPDRGGWRYTPGSDADLSVSGWMLVAVRSGELAGVRTDPATLAGVRRLLEASASAAAPARYAYNPRSPQQRPSALSVSCMTAVGALMRLHTGDKPDVPGIREPCRVLADLLPTYGTATNRNRDAYLWYYASQALVHGGGADWDRWYAALVETLAAKQEQAGAKAGSWDPLGPVPDRWGVYGGRLYVTALHLLSLEVPYRHLPTYGRAAGR